MEVVILIGVVCSIICASMATSRNRSTVIWAIVGFLFGILGVLAIAIAGNANV